MRKYFLIILLFAVGISTVFAQDLLVSLKFSGHLPPGNLGTPYKFAYAEENMKPKSVKLNSYNYGLALKKHIFADIHITAEASINNDVSRFHIYETHDLDTAYLIKVHSLHLTAGCEYVYFSYEKFSAFAGLHVSLTKPVKSTETLEIKTYTGMVAGMGADEESFKTDKITLERKFENILYHTSGLSVIPALELGIRFGEIGCFEPSVLIKPAYANFIFSEKKTFDTYVGIKIGRVF